MREVDGGQAFGDVNYVFPTFVTDAHADRPGGLIIAAIFAAAMSSIAAELNSLSTATVIDFYRRLWRTGESDAHYLRVSKLVTRLLGPRGVHRRHLRGRTSGSLIDVVNRFGSFFYGSLLGVFVLAIGVKRATSRGAFWGLHRRHGRRGAGSRSTRTMAFLWHNVVGATVVVVGRHAGEPDGAAERRAVKPAEAGFHD